MIDVKKLCSSALVTLCLLGGCAVQPASDDEAIEAFAADEDADAGIELDMQEQGLCRNYVEMFSAENASLGCDDASGGGLLGGVGGGGGGGGGSGGGGGGGGGGGTAGGGGGKTSTASSGVGILLPNLNALFRCQESCVARYCGEPCYDSGIVDACWRKCEPAGRWPWEKASK